MAKHAAEERKSWAIGLVASFLLSSAFVGGVIPNQTETAFANTATNLGACAANGVAGTNNGFTVTIKPSHGKAFYIDTGQGQDINAGYIGYRISASATVPDLNVRLSDFTGGVLALANPAEGTNYLGAVGTTPKAAYFFISAPKPTTTAQTHKVTVYSGNTPIISCTYTFDRVRETIKAAANKVIEISTVDSGVIGGNLVITHKGDTGVIGAGSTPDFDTMWLSPASNIAWPSTALKLVQVSVDYRNVKSSGNDNSPLTIVDDLILVDAARSGGDAIKSYIATYTFKIIGRASASIRPVAQISSGTQMKHTDMSSITATNFDTTDSTVQIRVTKSSSPATVVDNKIRIPFEVSLVNSGAQDVVLDGIEDVASVSGRIVTSTINFNGSSYSLGSSSSNTASATNTWVFNGPFSIPAGATRKLSYQMELDCDAAATVIEFKNSATAKIGPTVVGSSPTQSQGVRIQINSAGGATCSITSTSETQVETLPVEVVTGAVLNLTTSPDIRATISGTVDSNGVSGISVVCDYSDTSATLAGASTVTARRPAGGQTAASQDPQTVQCDLTNLNPDSLYYYRVRAGASASGEILSFRTPPAPAATPTITTLTPTNVGNRNATLRGEVNPAGQSVTLEFIYFPVSDVNCSSPGTITTLDKLQPADDGIAASVLIISGLYPTTFEYTVDSLTNNTTYCYRAVAKWGSTSALGASVSFTVLATVAPSAYTDPATDVLQTSATLKGSVDKGGNNARAAFCYTTTAPTTSVIAGCLANSVSATPSSITAAGNTPISLGLTGLTGGTRYYFQALANDGTSTAYGTIEEFVTPGPPVATTDTASLITSVSAKINGEVIGNGASTTVYFCVSTSASATGGLMNHCATTNRTNPSNTSPINADQTAGREANLTGLTPDTVYYFQIFATNTNGNAYGVIKSFRTLEDPSLSIVATYNPPEPVTVAANEVKTQSATLRGSVTGRDLNANLTFCYSLASNLNPCIAVVTGTPSSVVAGNAVSVSKAISGLTPSTTYYFALIAEDSSTSVTASALSFTTDAAPATTSTTSSTSDSATTSPSTASTTSETATTSTASSPAGGSTTATSSPATQSPATQSPPLCSAFLSQNSLLGNPVIRWLTTMTQYVGNFLKSLFDTPLGALVANTLFIQSPVLGEAGYQSLRTEPIVNLLGNSQPKKSEPVDTSTIELEEGSTEGQVNLETTDGQTLELLSLESSDLDLDASFSGSDFNNPLTWQALGYGPKCWKLEPFTDADYFYTLPSPIQLPPGTAAGNWVYSNVIVKAGSLTARSDTYQTDTVFASPKPGDRVFADINANGIFDPGGKNGDKAISHIIICITNLSAPAPTQSPAATTSPVTTTSPTTSPAVTSSPTTSPAVTTSPTASPAVTTSPTASTTVSPTPATQSPAPTRSEIVLPEDCVWAEPTKSPPIAPPEPTKSPEIIILVERPTQSGGVPINPGGTGWTPLPVPSAPQNILYSSPQAPCVPDNQYSVAMRVTNGTGFACMKVTSIYMTYLAYPSLFKAPPAPPVPSSSDAVTKSPAGNLADTGFENLWLVPFALLMFLLGAGLIRIARRND